MIDVRLDRITGAMQYVTIMRSAIRHLKENDAVMRTIIERIGPLKPAYREPTFESLVRAIVFQQLNGKAARTI
jgi:DNA-3-methyladenine glycosylase II